MWSNVSVVNMAARSVEELMLERARGVKGEE